MINGIDYSSNSKITDIQAVVSGQLLVDFAYLRLRGGYVDDPQWTPNRAQIKTAHTSNGSVLWGGYSVLGYSGAIGSDVWTADGGAKQVQDAWKLLTAGGADHNLPLALDLERPGSLVNGVRQYLALPSAEAYCSAYLLPAIDAATSLQGRKPVIYTNGDFIVNYLAVAGVLAKYPVITSCPLWIAGYNKLTVPPFWDRISKFWPVWLAWQYAGDVHDWPGISDVDLNRMPGTRAQLKAWLANPNAPLPTEGAPDPILPPVVNPPASDLETRVKALEDWRKWSG